MKVPKSYKYKFQWGEQQSMISAEYWADHWGGYPFGIPRKSNFFVISENKYLDTYASQEMLREMHIFSKVLLKKIYQLKLLQRSKQVQSRYWSFYKKFKEMNFFRLSNTELYLLLSDYLQKLYPIADLFTASDDKGLHAVTKKVESILRKKKMPHLLSVLTTPSAADLFIQEQKDLHRLARNMKVTKGQLLKHAKKHAWLFFNSYNETENIRYIRSRLHESFDIKKKLHAIQRLRARQQVIFKGLRSQELKELCIFMQKMGIDRLHLKNCWAGAEFRFLDLFREISKRLNIEFYKMMASYRYEDYQSALLTGEKLTKSEVNRRQKKFILWKQGNALHFSDSQGNVSIMLNSLRKGVLKKNSKKVQGIPANPGVVRGVCRLVRSVDIRQVLEDMKKFKKGEILITWMTQPNMVPIARKAAAIIADEGGMMSHAAVIAREFGVPCIVGAHNSTKVLKTGDRVEVNATKGIVKKI